MSTVEKIEKAVSQLPPEELIQFRAWFEEFEAARSAAARLIAQHQAGAAGAADAAAKAVGLGPRFGADPHLIKRPRPAGAQHGR